MSHTVSAEIVANVLSVDVAVGDTVGPLDSVVLLESMKMEIPVLADVTGTVVEIVVAGRRRLTGRAIDDEGVVPLLVDQVGGQVRCGIEVEGPVGGEWRDHCRHEPTEGGLRHVTTP